MSAPAQPATEDTDGGRVARRAVIRWGIRLFRAEWRQQLVVLSLLTVAVAAAVAVATGVHVITPAVENATFGAATHRFSLDNVDPVEIDATVDAATDWFAEVETIRRGEFRVDGRGDAIATRVQDPTAPLGAPMLALLTGRYPVQAGEIAVSEPVASELGVVAGSTLAVEGGAEMNVVGVVENPNSRSEQFILASPEFGAGVSSVTLLVDADGSRAESFRGLGDPAPVFAERGSDTAFVAVAVLGMIEVALVMVALIAAAGFVAIAQRRQRQLGMLAAIGATEQHLRLVTISNGAVVGAAAAILGAALGLSGWLVVAPVVGERAGLRLDRFDMPWWLLAAIVVLAVLTTTAAAWWPARIVASVPITEALAGRRPSPTKPGRSLALAGGFAVGGIAALAFAGDIFSPTANGIAVQNALLTVGGAIAIVVGVLLLSPYAIGLLGIPAERLYLPVRIAFRDLGRYQSRSGAALAAVSLALGIPLAVTIAAATAKAGPDAGNVGANQILITSDSIDAPLDAPVVTARPAAEQQQLNQRVGEIASTLPGAEVIPLDKVFDPAGEPSQFGLDSIRVERSDTEKSDSDEDGPSVFVASPELLAALNIPEPADGIDLLTTQTGELTFRGVVDPTTGRRPPVPVANPSTIAVSYESLPSSLLTPEALLANGWATARAGWLLQTDQPLTATEIAELRTKTLSVGLAIETRNNQRGLAQLGTIATAAGIALALGILAMTVGLLRSEATSDLQTLTATGATSFTRRALTASTAAGLAGLGVLLALIGAYAGLSAATRDLPASPIPTLLATIAGVPILAAAAGWLASGREPDTLTRNPLSP